MEPEVLVTEPETASGQALPPVPIWPLRLVFVLAVAASVAYEAGVAGRAWWFGGSMVLVLVAVLWHQTRAYRLGYEPPSTNPLDTWDGGGMGGPW
jgi:hypothetical protein